MVTVRLVFLSLLALYLIVGVWTTRRVNATGDEIYYFMAADALVRGEGLELTERWRDLARASYAPGVEVSALEFERSTSPSRTRAGAYPLHDLGTSLVIALPLAVGGRALTNAFVAVIMALAIAFGARAARALVGQASAIAAAVAVGVAAPALTYSGQVFADALAPLPVAIAVCALVGALPRWTLGPAVAALPFLHLRFWPLALGLLAVYVLTLRPRRGELLAVLAPLIAMVVVLIALDAVIYGIPLPHAGFLLFFSDRPGAAVAEYARPTGEGLIGLFIDRSFGLLSAAPLMTIAAFGAGVAARTARLAPLAIAVVPYLIVASILDWTGGWNPQARYLAVLTPFAVVLLALVFQTPAARFAAIPLGLWTIGQSAVYAVAPALRYDSYGAAPLADLAWIRLIGVTPSGIFPLFGCCGLTTAVLAGAWSILLLALVLIGARVGTRVTPASH